MTTRRDFLKAGTAAVATGIVFCGCGLLHSAHAQQPARQTLPVMVNEVLDVMTGLARTGFFSWMAARSLRPPTRRPSSTPRGPNARKSFLPRF